MHSFREFLSEAKSVGGIAHLEHPADRLFDGPEATHHAVNTIKGVASGKTPVTRKIDDKMSFQAVRTPEGKVGVKYKGSGSTYNFSAADVEKQHAHKPYLAGPINTLLKHVGKVLPEKAGEYQGGFMSTPETREEKGGHISHTPNTVEYHTPVNSAEGQKLKKSKVSLAVHTKLEGPERSPSPITSMAGFRSHPDVHQVQHVVSDKERQIHPDDKKIINSHINAAQGLLKGHDHSHLSGHETTLRTYINSTVRNDERPTTGGYRAHLSAAHDKKIEGVKMESTKDVKRAEKAAALAHVDKHKKAFDRTLDIHHHIQQATNHLADALDKSSASGGGFQTRIGGQASGGEGYVANGLKIVNRPAFSKANLLKNANMRTKIAEESEHISEAEFDRYHGPRSQMVDATPDEIKGYNAERDRRISSGKTKDQAADAATVKTQVGEYPQGSGKLKRMFYSTNATKPWPQNSYNDKISGFSDNKTDKTGKIDDIVDLDPELKKRVPGIGDVKVTVTPKKLIDYDPEGGSTKGTVGTTWGPAKQEKNLLGLSTGRTQALPISPKKDDVPVSAKSPGIVLNRTAATRDSSFAPDPQDVAGHEIQHAVQHMTGQKWTPDKPYWQREHEREASAVGSVLAKNDPTTPWTKIAYDSDKRRDALQINDKRDQDADRENKRREAQFLKAVNASAKDASTQIKKDKTNNVVTDEVKPSGILNVIKEAAKAKMKKFGDSDE